jgi:hypothetical protein
MQPNLSSILHQRGKEGDELKIWVKKENWKKQ